ncbi:MAG: hypothetical protein M0018_03340 [Nitrospiraceae bacterium]|nr:hypothetical protein [Nitrospiraceae bacterium]
MPENQKAEGAGALPLWLLAPEPARAMASPGRRRPFFERTLAGAVRFMDEILFNESVSAKNGFLQKVDPRIKMICAVALIIALSFQKGPQGMLPFVFFALLLAAASFIPPVMLLKRLLPPLVLTSLIAFPAALNIVTKGHDVFVLFGGLYVTRPGLLSAAGLVLRAVGSVMFVFLVSFTTPPVRLVKAIGAMAPGFFRVIFETGYRYIFFFVRKLEEFVFAMKARFSGGVPGAEGRRWVGSRAATLLLIGAGLKDELTMAMQARGITYEYPQPSGNISRPGEFLPGTILVLLCSVFIFMAFLRFPGMF